MDKQINAYKQIRKNYSDVAKSILYSADYDEQKAHFIGVILYTSDDINVKILEVIKDLKKETPNNLYVSKDFLHVTLKDIAFLPETFNSEAYSDYISRIESIIKKVTPFKIRVQGINHFPNVIFGQVFSDDNKLYDLRRNLEKVFPECKSAHDYVPHVTMAQFLEKPVQLFHTIKKYEAYDFGEMNVNKIALVRCDLPSKGKTFEIIKTFNLG